MIHYKTKEDIEKIRQSALLVSKTLGEIARHIKAGITTKQLDQTAEAFIRDHGAEPGFKGYNNFPATLCTSVNEQVVHGIPDDRPLEDGDILSVDCGVLMDGFYGDHAYTFAVGGISPEIARLVQVTKESLDLAIEQVRVGRRIGDIGYAVQNHARKHGYHVVRQLTGHGLGRDLHEEPTVPNYGSRGRGLRIQNGLVIAIEPMINMGTTDVRQIDGHTIITADRKPSAHFEHNIAVVDGKAEVLSTFKYIEDVLENKA